MEQIVIKKQKSHRIIIRLLVLLACFACFLLIALTRDFRPVLVMLVLTLLPMIVMLYYFETWSVVLHKNELQLRSWGRLRSYTWSDVAEVYSFRAATEGPYVRIRFRDGKQFRFRMEDENGFKAVGVIMKHTSIVSK